MRPIIFSALLAITPIVAQAFDMPATPRDFPEPGTFCAPLTLCPTDLVTKDRRD